jgi:hypothetical protein
MGELQDMPHIKNYMGVCLKHDMSVPVFGSVKVAVLIMASGHHIWWVDELVQSIRQHLLLDCTVQIFVFTDQPSLAPEGDDVVVIKHPPIPVPAVGRVRHHTFLSHAELYADADYAIALHAGLSFTAPVGREILGRRIGVLNAFHFLQSPHAAPFPRHVDTVATVPRGSDSCYYSAGFFGGSVQEFLWITGNVSWAFEYDYFVKAYRSRGSDESYINWYFSIHKPVTSLPGSYIYPEPPTDRLWTLQHVRWDAAFYPRVLDLGIRKELASVNTNLLAVDDSAQAFPSLMHLLKLTKKIDATDVTFVVQICSSTSMLKSSANGAEAFLKQQARASVHSLMEWQSGASMILVDTLTYPEPRGFGSDHKQLRYVHMPELGCGGIPYNMLQPMIKTRFAVSIMPGTVPSWRLRLNQLTDAASEARGSGIAVSCHTNVAVETDEILQSCRAKHGPSQHLCTICSVTSAHVQVAHAEGPKSSGCASSFAGRFAIAAIDTRRHDASGLWTMAVTSHSEGIHAAAAAVCDSLAQTSVPLQATPFPQILLPSAIHVKQSIRCNSLLANCWEARVSPVVATSSQPLQLVPYNGDSIPRLVACWGTQPEQSLASSLVFHVNQTDMSVAARFVKGDGSTVTVRNAAPGQYQHSRCRKANDCAFFIETSGERDDVLSACGFWGADLALPTSLEDRFNPLRGLSGEPFFISTAVAGPE